MRLGLFGGTFDPIHLGHLILAEQCRETCWLDRVWFVVAGEPPHKRGERTAVSSSPGDGADRGGRASGVYGLGNRGHASRPALQRRDPGVGAPRATDDELFFLIGADSLTDLPTWREPGRIAQLATIVVVNRPGIEQVDPARLPSFGPGSRHDRAGHDPTDRHRLERPAPPRGGRPEHPLHGPARGRSLHRGSGAVSLTA